MTSLDPGALLRLRELLAQRGQPSLVPQPPSSTTEAEAEDLLAQTERVAPLCELLFLMMSADGECGETERELLRGAVRALSADSLRSAQIEQMLETFSARRRAEGMERRLQYVAAQLQVDRAEAEAAYSLAAAMALANQDVDPREHALLDELGELLGLSEKRRAELTEDAPP